MRRFQIPSAALIAGLAVLLSGCSGETPTAPSAGGGPGSGSGGSCTALVSMSATTQSPFVGSASIVRATVTRAGVPVPDGGSVQFSTDLGFFEENGLPTVSKTTSGGVADVTVFSTNGGTAHVKAIFDCANAQINLNFGGVPDVGPFISSLTPTTGSCAGGDTVTILGGRFGNGTADVFFGGVRGSTKTVTNTQITVTTPARTLKNPAVPEIVDVVVVVGGLSSPPKQFTYACVPPELKIFLSSINPTAGSPAGGDPVTILGGHFGTIQATTQVTFCGASAQISGQTDQTINVSTPRHALANPAISETCDVTVRRDIGLVSENSATLTQAFTYRGNGSGGTCNTDPTFFIASLTPNTGPADGGTTVTLTGSGFGSTASLMRVDFGGAPATITAISPTQINVSTPRRTLASPSVPETVDVTVTDLGSPVQRCARVVSGFAYTSAALTPTIYSISPTTGPNDASTRVSIFGTGFQFPMQVFMTGGGACGAQLVEASVSDISLSTIVFKTPIAVNNVCLMNQLVDVKIVNPTTGKTASCPSCFKYYACPPISGTASPSSADGTVATTVVISGANFEEPITANFSFSGGLVALNVTSVSSNAIVLTMPPLSQIQGNSPTCADVSGTINISFLSLTCSPTAVPFTYHFNPPFATSAAPTNLSQDGSPFPSIGAPATITVTGGNFTDPMTVQLIKDGSVVSNTPVNNATVTNATTLTFVAPAVLDSSMNQQNCLLGGTVSGLQLVPTSFGIRLKSARTNCTVDLANVLVYHPIDPTCK